MRPLILAALLATTALPAQAGGPVMIEDAAEEAPVVQKRDNTLLWILAGATVAAIVLGGGSDACQGPNDTPAPPVSDC